MPPPPAPPPIAGDMPAKSAFPEPEKKDAKDFPTVLAALMDSTPEERAADPTKAKDLASRLYTLMCDWARASEPWYRESDLNHDFHEGRQWSYWSLPMNARIPRPEASTGVTRLTFNKIAGAVERCVQLLVGDEPIIKCLAGDSEIVDVAASESADDIVEWCQKRAVLAALPERIAREEVISGDCWQHTEWDGSLGPMVPQTNDDGSPVFKMGPDGQPLQPPEFETAPEGDFVDEVLGARQVVTDPSATQPFMGSIFIRKQMSRFDLANRFPDVDLGATQPDGDEKLRKLQSGDRTTNAPPGLPSTTIDSQSKDAIEAVILYVPKCADYPLGRRIVFTENALFEEVDNPRCPLEEEAAKGESEPNPCYEPPWPMFPYVYRHRRNSARGKSSVPAAIPAQKFINGLASVSADHVKKIGRAKVKVPNDLAAEWTDETQVFKVPRRGFDHNTLGYLSPPPMSQDNLQLWNKAEQELIEAMDLNMPAMGQQETSGQSGRAIDLRQAAANDAMKQARKRFGDMMACNLRYKLFLFGRYANTKRKIQILGENRRSSLRELDRTAVLPNTNVWCANDSFMPRDPQARMVTIMGLLAGKSPFDLPADQRQEVFELLRMQDFKAFEEHKMGDRMRARRQIQRALDGKEPGAISEVDDHLVQMATLGEYLKSEECETLVEKELMAAQQQLAQQPPAPVAPPQPGMPPMAPVPPPQPTSLLWTRLFGLWKAHSEALVAQTAAASPPPPPPMSGGTPAPKPPGS